MAEKKRKERAVVLAEQNAQLAPYRGEKANERLKELFEQEKYGEMAELFFPKAVCTLASDLIDVWWKVWDIYWIFAILRYISCCVIFDFITI